MPNRDAARRFMMVLDALYERGLAIAVSAMRPIETLLVDLTILPEFSRTVSHVAALHRLPVQDTASENHDPADAGSGCV